MDNTNCSVNTENLMFDKIVFNEVVKNLECFAETDNMDRAMLILPDGTMYSGDAEKDTRVVDHREVLEPYFDAVGHPEINRYEGDMWNKIRSVGIMVIAPEALSVILPTNLTDKQIEISLYYIDSGYNVEPEDMVNNIKEYTERE